MRLLFADHHARKSACTYYRQEVPHKTINKLKLAEAFLSDPVGAGGTEEERLKYYLGCDSVLYYAISGPGLVKLTKSMRKFPVQKHADDSYSYPPTIYKDIDDNTHFVSPFNPAFAKLGTRDLNGKLFSKGEWIWVANDANLVGTNPSKKELTELEKAEKVKVLWKDGKNGFDVADNKRKVRRFDQLFKLSHGASFTSERLRTYYKEKLNLKNTYVFPNSVVFEDYPSIPLLRDKGTVKVLWQGGDSHYGDWYTLKDSLGWTTSKFDEVRWVIWGTKYGFIHETLAKNKWHFEPWVPYEAYKLRLATIDFDFVVAPLAANMFNEGKSCIKWYEASALPEPRPVLAARVPPYSDEIIDGETGLLYGDDEEFKVKFEALVRDGALRDRLAKNAKEWIGEYRQASKTVPPYAEWISKTTDVIRRRRSRYARLEKPTGKADLSELST